jgi:beta-glucosidase/6-phospho-beta-glucosidase/beta-galactosidase
MSTFLRLEKTLLPPPEIIHWNGGYLVHEKCTTAQKIAYCTKNFFLFTALLIALPLTLSYDWLQHKPVAKIEKILSPTPSNWLPEQRGFATSHFQTQGLGTRYSAVPGLEGKNDWDEWMKNRKHIESPDNFNYQDFFTDIFTNPAPYIEMLKAHNVTAHRFSLEWSVIEPRPGEIDQKAVDLYRNFIQALQKAGITPSVTLSHFVMPKWFYESGNFQNMENVDRYVQFALKAIELFPEVNDWWSFNELGVKALQQAREVYPTDVPEGSSLPTRVYKAGIATRNMLIAHCKLHEEVTKLHPTKKLGVTHQWLTFDTASGNWLERLFAYFFTKFSFTPVYQFFKDGCYSFEFPFMANIQFRVTQEEFEQNSHFPSGSACRPTLIR